MGQSNSDAPPKSCDETEVLQFADVLDLVDGEFEYLHTDVLYRSGDKIFSAVSHIRAGNETPDLDDVTDITEIPIEVFPEYDAHLFGPIIESPGSIDCYVKRPYLLGFKDVESSHAATLMTTEANLLKVLRESPHKHLANYIGCIVSRNRVTALCFQKYVETLGHRVREGIHVDIDTCMADVRSAISHLHSLGFAHNDVNPENVMFDSDDVAVLLDFDASKQFGEVLLKAGTYGWNDNHKQVSDESDNHKKVSDESNDLNAVEQLEFYLRNEAR